MKVQFLVLAAFVAVAVAAPPNPEIARLRSLPALRHEEVRDEFGQYALRYVTAEGTVVSQSGRLVPTPDGTAYVLEVTGETSYVSDNGKTYVTKYKAGLDGNHVAGAHLPVPPPVPELSPVPVQ